MTDFTEKFTTYSNSELLKIIESPDDYQPSAVETAKIIFETRNLSDKEIEMAEIKLEELKLEKEAKENKRLNLEKKTKIMASSFLSMVNPIQIEEPTTDKIIRNISIVLGGLFLFGLYKDFGMISLIFNKSTGKLDIFLVFCFLPFFIIPFASILFFKRLKIGWTLLSIFLSYSVVSSFKLLIIILNRTFSNIPAFDNFLPKSSLIGNIISFLFYIGILLIISKEEIREVYSIDKRHMFISIIISALLTTFILFS
jgi:hypothetical protein